VSSEATRGESQPKSEVSVYQGGIKHTMVRFRGCAGGYSESPCGGSPSRPRGSECQGNSDQM
jgi:hypothetical protein